MTVPPRVLMMTGEWPVPGRPGLPSFARRQADSLHSAGLSVDIFAFRAGNPYDYAAAWTRLRPQLVKSRYDLIHAHFAHGGLLALPKRLPLVVTLRDRDFGVGEDAPFERRPRLRRFATSVVARRADAVIIGSDDLRRHLPAKARVYVIPSDLQEDELTERLVSVYWSVLAPA